MAIEDSALTLATYPTYVHKESRGEIQDKLERFDILRDIDLSSLLDLEA
jgi:hypothetical protein